MMFLKFKKTITLIAVLGFFICLLVFPQRVSAGVIKGLMTSSQILIPALFPFSVAAVFLSKSRLLSFKNQGKFGYYFLIFILSAIGGYPIGAKILTEEYKNAKIERHDAEKALSFCINAGPSFVISFVGFSIFSSRKIGFLLLFSHLLASFTVFSFSLFRLGKPKKSEAPTEKISITDSFVESVADACKSMIIICGYAVFFAGVIPLLSSEFLPVKILAGSLEITNSLMNVKSIYTASFLLGFSGLSIIFQVLATAKPIIKNVFRLFLGRIFHGGLSVLYTFILFKIFKPEIPVFKTNRNFNLNIGITGALLSVLLLICGICLIT
ncbi:MAG: hypothetical protein KBS52_00495, partial [Clostridiales bacterium]|nr:hypothetical protein [Candidatus Equinaster intestinalis]